MKSFALLVIWNDGREEYLHEGLGDITARFSTKAAAQRQKEFMLVGMSDEVQSINVVGYPKK